MRYLHTMLRTSDLGRTRDFLEALGYQPTRQVPQFDSQGCQQAVNYFFAVEGDETELELHVPLYPYRHGCGAAWGHVALGVSDLDGVLRRLADRGIAPQADPAPLRPGGPRLCLIPEPVEGHLFELIETT